MSRRACGKVTYGTAAFAEMALGVLLSRTKDPRKDLLRTYQCRACDGWHIGHVRHATSWEQRVEHDERAALEWARVEAGAR